MWLPMKELSVSVWQLALLSNLFLKAMGVLFTLFNPDKTHLDQESLLQRDIANINDVKIQCL